MQCCLIKLIYIKTNFFLHFVGNISIISSFLMQDPRFFFCSWKMTKNIYEINQHWPENSPMKCFMKRLVYVKTNLFFYLVECSFVWINVLTLELCLNIVIRNGKTSFWFFWLWSQELFLRLNKTCKTSTE